MAVSPQRSWLAKLKRDAEIEALFDENAAGPGEEVDHLPFFRS